MGPRAELPAAGQPRAGRGRSAEPEEEMRVMFAAAEFAPIARVGGLAEAAAGLVGELRNQGVIVEVVLPDYGGEALADERSYDLDVPAWMGSARARTGTHRSAGPVTLIEVGLLRRSHPYLQPDGQGWPDNDERFFGFSAALASWAESPACSAHDVLHLNDWHAAATVGFRAERQGTILSVHNLAYQGISDRLWLERLPYHRAAFEYFEGVNPLGAAIALADKVVAVSPRYAEEIKTAEGGMGLDGLLRRRKTDLVGIRNGIDVSEWDPSSDDLIEAPFTLKDVRTAKSVNRAALLRRFGLFDTNPSEPQPVIGVVSRLVEQKGIDLLIESCRFLDGIGAQMVVLGSGDKALADALRDVAAAQPDRIGFVDGYDVALAHQVFAGCDLFAMPSRFEPCGLAQMQAMAYGAIPVVTDVGGLHDTVVDADIEPDKGNGIVAGQVNVAGFVDALHRAVRLWSSPARLKSAQRLAMKHDWSWRSPAGEHIELYRTVRRPAI